MDKHGYIFCPATRKFTQFPSRSSSSSSSTTKFVKAQTKQQKRYFVNGKKSLTFSFSGAGWMLLFHLGAVKAIQEHPEILANSTFCGASGGALAAACAALNVDVEKLAKEVVIKKSKIARRNKIDLFRLRPLVTEGIDTLLEEVGYGKKDASTTKKEDPRMMTPEEKELEKHRWYENVQSKLQGRCQVYVTGLPEFSKIVEQKFESKTVLVESLVASCTIPPFAGFPFVNSKGKLVVDGGFREMQPRRTESHVITVSPFIILPYEVEVKPSSGRRHFLLDYEVPQSGPVVLYSARMCRQTFAEAIPVTWALFPPNEEKMQAVFDAGYYEMKFFLDDLLIEYECAEGDTLSSDFVNFQDRNVKNEEEMKKFGVLPRKHTYWFKIFMINLALTVASVGYYF